MESFSTKHIIQKYNKLLITQIESLITSIQTSRVQPDDIIYHFFSQFIDSDPRESTEFRKKCKIILKNILKCEHFLSWDPKIASKIIKESLPIDFYPDKMLGKIYLSDIRNCVVFIIYKSFKIMADTEFLRDSNPPGNTEQNISYNKYAHGRPALVDPKDSERLENILKYYHLVRLVFEIKIIIKNPDIDKKKIYDNYGIINTFDASCLHYYETTGMKNMIRNLFLCIWNYDNT